MNSRSAEVWFVVSCDLKMLLQIFDHNDIYIAVDIFQCCFGLTTLNGIYGKMQDVFKKLIFVM